jgi:hypothetical protein
MREVSIENKEQRVLFPQWGKNSTGSGTDNQK